MRLQNRIPCTALLICLFAAIGVAQEADTQATSAPPTEPPDVETLAEVLVESRYDILGRVSPRGLEPRDRERIVQLLISQLNDFYPDIRARAADALALFGPDAKPALPHLMKRIGDREVTVAYPFAGVWVSVSKAVAAIGPEAIDTLMAALPDCDRATYYGISAAISELGEHAKSVAPKFIEVLREGPEDRRWATMYTLSHLGDAALSAIPDYIKNLDHEEFNIQVIACRALAELGPAAKPAVPKLLELMEKGILSSRTHAAMCLGAIGPVEDADLVELFSQMVQEPNAFCQERGMIALGRLGRHARGANELIERLIEQEDFSQKPEAARTLWQVTGDNTKTIDVLKRLIDDPTYDSRVYAVVTDMGPAAAPMATQIASKLDTDDQSLRLVLVAALAKMGPAAKDQLDILRATINDSSPEVAIAIDKAIAVIDAE